MIKIQDIATLSNGINFRKSAYTSGVKLIGVSDFKDRIYPDFGSLQEVNAKVVKKNDFLHKGDIVFVRSNGNKELVGRCMLIDKEIPVTYSGFCIRLRLNDTALYDPTYFTYLFKSRDFRKAMSGTAVGANIQNLSQGRLGSYEFECPTIDVQHRIATILSHYDTLIENYRKQIKLLEEAAQCLYKEWFVGSNIEDAKNMGGHTHKDKWEKRKIMDVYDFKYGKILPKKSLIEGGKIPVYGASKVIGYFNKANCFEPRVLIGSRGNAGYVHRTIEKSTYVTNNSFIVIPKEEFDYISLPFIYESFKCLDFTAICTGAAQPQLTINSISNFDIYLPPQKLIEKFCQASKKYFDCIANDYNQIRILTEARDLLLPKLMSGEIEM